MTRISLTACLLVSLSATAWAGRADEGKVAPWFKLESVSGKTITRDSLKGKPSILVVGTTYDSAPPCKKWVMQLSQFFGGKVNVYQVIVARKPWFLPRHVVMSKVKDFTPKSYYDQVLIEWYKVFADTWGVAQHSLPTLFVVNPNLRISMRMEGSLTPEAFAAVGEKVKASL